MTCRCGDSACDLPPMTRIEAIVTEQADPACTDAEGER